MAIKNFLSDAVAVRIALVLGKLLTRRAGYRLADSVGKWISNRQHYEMVRAVKANQWVVHEGKLSTGELNARSLVLGRRRSKLLSAYATINRQSSLCRISVVLT